MINWLKDVLDRSHERITEKKESSINTMGPSTMPLQVQEQRRTSQDAQRLREHLDNQLKSHAQNNAMLMHKGDCDIFVCTGCDLRVPDKIVSEVYEVDSYRPQKCRSRSCKSMAEREEVLCAFHLVSKCAVIHCLSERVEDWPREDAFCLTHSREFMLSKWSGDESRNPDKT